MCGVEQCKITLTHDPAGVYIDCDYYTGDNIWEIWWGDRKVGVLNLGTGTKYHSEFMAPAVTEAWGNADSMYMGDSKHLR